MKKICSVNNKGAIRLFEGNGNLDIRLYKKKEEKNPTPATR